MLLENYVSVMAYRALFYSSFANSSVDGGCRFIKLKSLQTERLLTGF